MKKVPEISSVIGLEILIFRWIKLRKKVITSIFKNIM